MGRYSNPSSAYRMRSMRVTDHGRRGFIAVSCLVLLRGEARTFENNVRFRLKDSEGNILVDSFTTAAGEMGTFGSFEAEVSFGLLSGKEGMLEIFEESAEGGSEIGRVSI